MRAPSPTFVLAICLAIAIFNVVSVGPPSTPRETGYLVGTVAVPVIVWLLYLGWYRRRHRTPG